MKKLEASNRKQKEMYGRMFGGTSKDKRESTTTTATTSESSWVCCVCICLSIYDKMIVRY